MMAPDLTIEDLFSKEKFIFIAGPCAVESEEQVIDTARFLKTLGINFMRGGAYKPRTSPKSFQGLKEEGLKILAMAKEDTIKIFKIGLIYHNLSVNKIFH